MHHNFFQVFATYKEALCLLRDHISITGKIVYIKGDVDGSVGRDSEVARARHASEQWESRVNWNSKTKR